MAAKLIARKNSFPYFRAVHPRRKLLLRMDTTNHCNLRCSMCPMRLSDNDDSKKRHHMSSLVFKRIAEEVFPLSRTVGISCGAEPLANPDFFQQLRKLVDSGVPFIEMVTNGTLLTPERIRLILDRPPTSLFISIDGALPETHARIRDGADLHRIISMLRLLVHERGGRRFPMIGFSTTLQKNNYRELEAIVQLASDTGAESVGVVPLVPYEGLDTLGEVADPDSPPVAAALAEAALKAQRLGLRFHVSRNAVKRETAHPCPYLQGTVYIDPDGSIFPCPYWNTEVPLGNIMEGFTAVWYGKAYNRLREGDFCEKDNCLACPEVTGGSAAVVKGMQ